MRAWMGGMAGVLGMLALVAPSPVRAHGGNGAGAPAPAAAEAAPCHDVPAPDPAPAGGEAAGARVTVADVPLVDQRGTPTRFAEVAGGRVVAVNFIYTTCTTVCPVLSGLFTSLQDRLGDKLGSQVQLVSVSIDPARDTPERLSAMAARHRSKPGWRWLTGAPDQVEELLRGFGTYTPDPAKHGPAVLVGDPSRGRWVRMNGFPTAEAIAGQLDRLLAERSAGAGVDR